VGIVTAATTLKGEIVALFGRIETELKKAVI
jgi:Flp pilus assembly pilin Flp